MMNEPIKDQTAKPLGLLPKNVQSWVIVGIAVLMIAIMWLTGGKKPAPAKTSSPTIAPPAPVEVNETKIADLQKQIEELQKEQLAAQNALSQESRLLGAPSTEQSAVQGVPPTNRPESVSSPDELQAERRKRAYLSLFASNLALSYRKDFAPTSNSNNRATTEDSRGIADHGTEALQLAQFLKEIQPPLQTPASTPSANTVNAPPQPAIAMPSHDAKEPDASPRSSHNAQNAAFGKSYIVFEGTVLETVLINRLDGQFSGPVECLLSSDIYSHDRQHLLIPTGTKVVGEAKKVEAFGQTRLAVVFHRLIMPDGYSVSLDQFKGLDQIGDTGLRDQVNNHYLRIFGVSLAIGALGAVSEAGTSGTLVASGTDQMRQGFAVSSAQSASQILDRFLNIPPTVTIREGHRVKVYLAGDLLLPDYANHQVPSDL